MPKLAVVNEVDVPEEESLLDLAVNPRTPPSKLAELRNHKLLKRIFVEIMADPRKRMTYLEFARRFGLNPGLIWTWTRDQKLDGEIKARIKEILGSGNLLKNLYRKMYHQAMRGSYKHQRLLLEIAKEYTPGLMVDAVIDTPEARYRVIERERLRALTKGTSTPRDHPSEEGP